MFSKKTIFQFDFPNTTDPTSTVISIKFISWLDLTKHLQESQAYRQEERKNFGCHQDIFLLGPEYQVLSPDSCFYMLL